MTDGLFIAGDGSGGGGGAPSSYHNGDTCLDVGMCANGGAGGNGGGADSNLTGSLYSDVIFGDGSGGGGAGGFAGGQGGLSGNGNDFIFGNDGNDILFGDGFNGASGHEDNGDADLINIPHGGNGGLGGGGGGAGGGAETTLGGDGGAGGIGAGGGGGGYSASNGGLGGFGAGGGAAVFYDPFESVAGASMGLGGGSGSRHASLGGPGGGSYFGFGGSRDDSFGGDGARSDLGGANGGNTGPGYDQGGSGGGGFGYFGHGGDGSKSNPMDGVDGEFLGDSHLQMNDTENVIYDYVKAEIETGQLYVSTPGTLAGEGAGNDVLDGGAGSDDYFGQGGKDIFVIDIQESAATDHDVIHDFEDGVDKIRLVNDDVLYTSQEINTVITGTHEDVEHIIGTRDFTQFRFSNGSKLSIKNTAYETLSAADFETQMPVDLNVGVAPSLTCVILAAVLASRIIKNTSRGRNHD